MGLPTVAHIPKTLPTFHVSVPHFGVRFPETPNFWHFCKAWLKTAGNRPPIQLDMQPKSDITANSLRATLQGVEFNELQFLAFAALSRSPIWTKGKWEGKEVRQKSKGEEQKGEAKNLRSDPDPNPK